MKLSQVYETRDDSDVGHLSVTHGLYLKPMSRINITIHFPQLKQSIPTGGTNVSSWGIMEKLKALVAPDEFICIKTVKNTLEFILFEGDFENRTVLKGVIGRLDGKKMKITGIKEPLKILASETKLRFPTKYDWDTFFRDASNMNEMKPGERPDTIHMQNLPIAWFVAPKSRNDLDLLPSESVFRRVWEGFGDVRLVDIPMLDPYRSKIKTALQGIKTFNFSTDKVFEAYVQYKEYLGFVKAMDALRGCFLAKKDDNKLLLCNIKVDFDKTKHLSEESLKLRRIEIQKVKDKEAQSQSTHKKSSKKGSDAPSTESAKEKEKDAIDMDRKIAMEERKYLVARRKLEAIRLIDFLFERLKAKEKLKAETEARKRKKREQKRIAAEQARKEAENLAEIEKSETDKMRERLLAARRNPPSYESRRRESLRRAMGTYSTNLNRPYYYSSRVPYYSEEAGPSSSSVYGSKEADRAYEKYFRSITRRNN